jgi:hypothetical protein
MSNSYENWYVWWGAMMTGPEPTRLGLSKNVERLTHIKIAWSFNHENNYLLKIKIFRQQIYSPFCIHESLLL